MVWCTVTISTEWKYTQILYNVKMNDPVAMNHTLTTMIQ